MHLAHHVCIPWALRAMHSWKCVLVRLLSLPPMLFCLMGIFLCSFQALNYNQAPKFRRYEMSGLPGPFTASEASQAHCCQQGALGSSCACLPASPGFLCLPSSLCWRCGMRRPQARESPEYMLTEGCKLSAQASGPPVAQTVHVCVAPLCVYVQERMHVDHVRVWGCSWMHTL